MTVLITDVQILGTGSKDLGGPPNLTKILTGKVELFPRVTASQALLGYTDYRCIVVKNSSAISDFHNVQIFIELNSSIVGLDYALALGQAPVNQPEALIGAPDVPPAGVLFLTPTQDPTRKFNLDLGTLPKGGGYRSVWISRTIQAGSYAPEHGVVRLAVVGETD